MNPQQQPQNIERELNLISEVITKGNSGIIVLPAKPTPDAIASGTSLYLALTKMGKNVSLICVAMPETDIAGADKIKTSIQTGGNNLVVSFPYKEGAIDKVDYNVQNEKFNLIIIPREGQARLEPKDVEYSYSGGKIEFIITVDAPNLNSLGDIYTKNQNTFDGKNIINIDRHLINNNFGTINLVAKTAAATAELVLKVLQTVKAPIDKDIATNLYTGIVTATNNFSSYSVNADTFETVAQLLRAGAVKKPMRQFSRPGMPGQMGQNPFG
ncbi:MAG TPA: DHH family phosphoesterase, partial [Candidatus Woesebacteria bacterium]|nr:DHH family phosphoesterase [Candidatus Woesebacteria bacterium]